MADLVSIEEAVRGIPAGALITFGGFQLNRAPMALVRELIRQERRGLRVVTLPNPLPIDLLVGAGMVDEAEFGFIGFQFEDGFAVAPNMRRAIQEGTLRFRERDVYELIQGLRAAAMGLPFLAAPGCERSDYRWENGTASLSVADGEEVPVVEPIRPDIALVHAQEADRSGNLGITDPYAEPLLARASGRVVATAERIVDRVAAPAVPGSRVSHVVEAPRGAYPTGCHRHYRHDAAHLRDYLKLSRNTVDRPDGVDPATADRLVVCMARAIEDGDVVTTGVASALPMLAVAVARATRAPRLTYINCVGAVNPRIERASFTSVDVDLLDACEARITLPELFDMARQGRIDTMFFGAAQVDAEARINLTCIGEYRKPRVKLPGPAGSSSMRAYIPRVVLFVPRHSARTMVPRTDFATALVSPRNRETLLVSDKALMRLEGGRLRLASRHAGVEPENLREGTGFALEGDWNAMTPEPTPDEMAALKKLDPDGVRHRIIGGG
ncbi:MAG: CoA-transferase [Gemmatimonadota bacterium]